jgi:hypothetical protein
MKDKVAEITIIWVVGILSIWVFVITLFYFETRLTKIENQFHEILSDLSK